MGQVDVFFWLRNQRQSGDQRYFTVKQVQDGLRNQGKTNGTILGVRGDLLQLERMGYIEVSGYDEKKPWRDWQRSFRIKEKYLLESPESSC